MEKLKTRRVVVVEGRYDAVKLDAIVETSILTTDGFAIYSNKAQQQLFKTLAKKNGLLLLLDSDGAGFQLRNFITNLVGAEHVLQVYTPAIEGKERRKAIGGKEGLLGVEGIDTALLYKLIKKALAVDASALEEKSLVVTGVSAENLPVTGENETEMGAQQASVVTDEKRMVTYTDLYRWGFSGTAGSNERKIAFLKSLGLPPRLSKKELVAVLNRLYTYAQLEEKVEAFLQCLQ